MFGLKDKKYFYKMLKKLNVIEIAALIEALNDYGTEILKGSKINVKNKINNEDNIDVQ